MNRELSSSEKTLIQSLVNTGLYINSGNDERIIAACNKYAESQRGVVPAPKLKWVQQTDNSDNLCDDWTADFMGYYFAIAALSNGKWRVNIDGDPRPPFMVVSSDAGKKICQDWFRDQWQKEMGVPDNPKIREEPPYVDIRKYMDDNA